MNIRKWMQMLTLAAVLAVTAVSLPAMQVHAEPGHSNGCSLTDDTTDPPTVHFYGPGQRVETVYGTFICGDDGSWYLLASERTPTHNSPAIPAGSATNHR